MPEEHSSGKPADFFIGLVDFFAILLPGAILTFSVYECLQYRGGSLLGLLPNLPEGWVTFAAFALAAYVLGHLLFVIGSLCLDPLYDWWKESFGPKERKELKEKVGVDFAEIVVCLRLWSDGAAAEMDRLEADQKFFRGLTLVLLLAWPSFLWTWGRLNWPWLGLGLILLPLIPFRVFRRWLGPSPQNELEKPKELAIFQLWGLSFVLVGCVVWFCLTAVIPPAELEQPSLEQSTQTVKPGVPPNSGISVTATSERISVTATSENKSHRETPARVDKRWVASLLAVALTLSVVRFVQQRLKYTEFVYRAYLVLTQLKGPSGVAPNTGESH